MTNRTGARSTELARRQRRARPHASTHKIRTQYVSHVPISNPVHCFLTSSKRKVLEKILYVYFADSVFIVTWTVPVGGGTNAFVITFKSKEQKGFQISYACVM